MQCTVPNRAPPACVHSMQVCMRSKWGQRRHTLKGMPCAGVARISDRGCFFASLRHVSITNFLAKQELLPKRCSSVFVVGILHQIYTIHCKPGHPLFYSCAPGQLGVRGQMVSVGKDVQGQTVALAMPFKTHVRHL